MKIPFLAQDTAAGIGCQGRGGDLCRDDTSADRDRNGSHGRPDRGSWRFTDADAPLRIAGGASGGTITGIAFVGNTMYAVTDAGRLFRINNPTSPRFATAQYIASSAQDLDGIHFSALVAGPDATEDGRYANMLFGMDTDGTIYAFDTAGRLQPMFVNGQTSVETGLNSVHGLAFSTLEENPWAYCQW